MNPDRVGAGSPAHRKVNVRKFLFSTWSPGSSQEPGLSNPPWPRRERSGGRFAVVGHPTKTPPLSAPNGRTLPRKARFVPSYP